MAQVGVLDNLIVGALNNLMVGALNLTAGDELGNYGGTAGVGSGLDDYIDLVGVEDDGVVAERKNDHTGEHIDLVGMEDDGVVAERKHDHTGEHIDLVGVEDDRVAERRNDHTGEHKTLAGVGRILVEVGRGLAGVDTHSFGRDREYTVVKLVGDNTQIVGEDKQLVEELVDGWVEPEGAMGVEG